jgi:type I restriction enzyme S subunit
VIAIKDWELYKLGDINDLKYGKTLPISKFSSHGYEVWGANGVIGYHDTFSHEAPRVLVSSRGEKSGSINLSSPKSYITNNSIICEPKFDLCEVYLYYALESVPKNLMVSGSAQPQVVINDLKHIIVGLPNSKSEQTQIAEILSTVDQAIGQTEALIAKQQRIKTGLMQDLLTLGIDKNGNLRSEQTHQFKDSPQGRIPVEWEVWRLGESCEVCNNLRKPISALVRETMKGNYPYYGPTGILDYINEYRVDGKYVLIGEDGDHFLKFKTQEMTLLVDGKYNVNNHAHILQGKGSVLTEWLHLFFLHRDITLHLTRQGAGRFKLNKAALLDLPLCIPKETLEQERILNVMNNFRQNQNVGINNLKKLKSIRTALMQDLLTGKKRVTTLLNDMEVRANESG